jgi:hypothetical protein
VDLGELLAWHLEAGERVVAHETHGYCPRVLSTWTCLAVNRWMLERSMAAADQAAYHLHKPTHKRLACR